jgi:hypothetical protein
MRIGLVITAALCLALLGSTASGSESRKQAKLKLTAGIPLTIRGTNFLPNERVRVTVSGELRRTKQVIANRSGVFLVRFQTAFDRCSDMTALAVGARGSRAMLKMPQLGCPAP